MREGTVLKTVGGFFYLYDHQEKKQIKAVARGRLKKQGQKIIPGDMVCFVLEEEQAVVEDIRPRKNLLFRPRVANVDELVLVISLYNPVPDYFFIDKNLALAHWFDVPMILCLNKIDLQGEARETILSIYRNCLKYRVVETSALENIGVRELKEAVAQKLVVLLGPSGVGKSTLLNQMNPQWDLSTDEVSAKLRRGRHTTKHVELLPWEKGFITDTPGFSNVKVQSIPREYLPRTFVEFLPYLDQCYFNTCMHHKEPDCAVKQALKEGQIHPQRYEHYLRLLKEIDTHG